MIEAVGTQITRILSELGYDNIGTVEMLMDADGSFYFLEVNTRIQVEHAVTEMVTGVDLVEAQIRLAAGAPLIDVFPRTPKLTGHAIEARVYAEDPKSFFPSPGRLRTFRPPPNSERLRIETGYAEGRVVTQHYDPLLAKVIAAGPTRSHAIATLSEALTAFQVEGIKTNLPLLLQVLNEDSFATGAIDTGFINRLQKQRA